MQRESKEQKTPAADEFANAPLFRWANEQELRKQERALANITVPERYHAAISGKSFESSIPVKFSPEYQQQVLGVLESNLDRARERQKNRIYERGGPDSLDAEIKELQKLMAIASRSGPVKLLDYAIVQIAELKKKGENAPHYLKRLYDPHGTRTIMPYFNNLVGEGFATVHRKDLPVAITSGKLSPPAFPKEDLLKGLLRDSKLLQQGGRVIIIADDSDQSPGVTAKYLAERIASWDGIGSTQRTLTGKTAERVTAINGAYATEDKRLEILCVTSAQLKNLNSSGTAFMRAAIVVAYALKIRLQDSEDGRQKSGELHLPHQSKLPEILTRQLIELTHAFRPYQLARRLNVTQVDGLGDRADEPAREWWDR